MADRIFPNTVKKIATSKKEYNGINWASVEEQLTKLTKLASDYDGEDNFEGNKVKVEAATDSDGEHYIDDEYAEGNGGDPDFDVDEPLDIDDDEITEAQAFLDKLASTGEYSVRSAGEVKCEYCGRKGKETCSKCAKSTKCSSKDCKKTMPYGKMKKSNGKAYCGSKCAKSDGGDHTEGKSKDSKPSKNEFLERMQAGKDKPKKASAGVNNNNKKVVIAFTSLDQISGDAVLAAESAGDDRLKQTILDARHQRRLAIASQIEKIQEQEVIKRASVTKKQTQDDSTLEQRQAFREALIKTAMEKDQNKSVVETSSEENFGFKPVGELSFSEQDAFMKLAVKNGFPKEYVISMITPEVEDTEHLKPILEVISNKEMTRDSQVAAVTAMIKTSELSQKDLNYLKNYWSNQLGYPAKDWVESLFTSKFYKRIGKK